MGQKLEIAQDVGHLDPSIKGPRLDPLKHKESA